MNACPTCISESIQRALTLTPALEHMAGSYADELSQLTTALREEHSKFEARLTEVTSAISEAESAQIITAYCRHHELFPKKLAEHHPEVAVIYTCGDSDALEALNKTESLALVGARRASAYGREVAYSIANEAAGQGVLIITTMALGIAGAANRGALQGEGETIAFLAGPPDQPYPRSHKLLHGQILHAGAAISVVPPSLDVHKGAFALRSTLLGALADSSVFVEGTEQSNAMLTIDAARRSGNLVGAVPGPVTSHLSAGPNDQLTAGARLIRGTRDLYDFEPAAPKEDNAEGLDDPDRLVLSAIRAGHNTPRQIAEQLHHLLSREISTSLGRLELLGHVTRSADAYQPTS